ncbi:hypothetical protein PRIPAC_78858 [Pristionchus pacificus]|uniref:Uncharacterized protein n=1 Tax=Pristionchus pacificus TaxID=54126 RepID=A0A2A6CKU0_PRIPA|nr:hypothetical protein PRIPAC_78858 [Pristionchus pacificus]|eukprot:PDM78641.1 hypothetical protein PRIPAC_31220 [Pristionchus pacificus]
MGRIRVDKCCCGLTAARIFAVIAIIWAVLFIGLAFIHKHLYRWEPYFFGASGIFQLVAAVLVLVACTKKRDDLMVLQLIIQILVVVALVIFTCMMLYGQFNSHSRLQTSVRKLVTNVHVGSEHVNEDSREAEETRQLKEAEQNKEIEKLTKLYSAAAEDMPLETVKCKNVIPERISNNIQMRVLITLSTLIVSASAGLLGFTQSAAVRGILMCHDKPAAHVSVKLYDDDSGPDLDDLMDQGESDADGRFSLSGSESEFTTIDPKVNIYHDCDDAFTPCQRRISIYLPSKYVTQGDTPDKVYDAGVIQLAGHFSGETRDCLHRV